MKVGLTQVSSINSPTSLSSMRALVKGGEHSTFIFLRTRLRNSLVSAVCSSVPAGNFSLVASSRAGIISTRLQGAAQLTSYSSPCWVWNLVVVEPVMCWTRPETSSSVISYVPDCQ